MVEQARTDVGRELDGMSSLPSPIPGRYYDPYGNECTMGRWAELFESRRNETLARECGMPDGDSWWRISRDDIGILEVSTVWLGNNYRFGPGTPLIYETMIFGGDDEVDSSEWRYSTREAALAGHDRAVALVTDLQSGDRARIAVAREALHL